MLTAVLEGKLKGLRGEGKPLPDHPEDAFVSAGDAVGFRMMAQARVLPEEITIKKQLAEQRQALKMIVEPTERKSAIAQIAQLEMRYNIATEGRKKFMKD